MPKGQCSTAPFPVAASAQEARECGWDAAASVVETSSTAAGERDLPTLLFLSPSGDVPAAAGEWFATFEYFAVMETCRAGV